RSLARLSENKTTIIVSHRLSSVTHAGQIFVLDNGRVLEAGTHAELIHKQGQYCAMYSAQKDGYE
ncbi:MAG: ABC transporter ATP-binding protein, partial [Cognatishimia sp.]